MAGNTSRQNGKLGGRPKAPHTIEAEKAREILVKRVTEKAELLIQAEMDLALGYYKEVQNADGTTRIYQLSPDTKAIHYLLDQVVGKPKESVELPGGVTLIMDV